MWLCGFDKVCGCVRVGFRWCVAVWVDKVCGCVGGEVCCCVDLLGCVAVRTC